MDRNIKIAKQLLKIAKSLVANNEIEEKSISVNDIQKTVDDLYNDNNVRFLQMYTCVSGCEHEGEEDEHYFNNWYDWIHVKSNDCKYHPGKDVWDYVEECYDECTLDEIVIMTVEYKLQGDETMHVIKIDDPSI